MTEKPQLHGEAPVTTTEEPARSMLEDLLDSRGVQPATTATCLIGECIDDRHPTLRGRVQVRLGERDVWVPTLLNLPVRRADRVLLIRPANGDEWIVTGVVDGFARRPEPVKTEAARVELRPDETVQVVASEGQPLLELSRGTAGPVVRLLDPDVSLELAGKLAIKAAEIRLEATGGRVALTASDDVVVKGEVVRLN